MRSIPLITTTAYLALIIFAPVLDAQKNIAANLSSYDVVSIKLEDPDVGSKGIRKTPTGFEANMVSLKDLIAEAYGLQDQSLILNEPKWKTRFHVVAKLDGETAAKLDGLPVEAQRIQRQVVLQTLLAEYFHLSVHRSRRELSTYSLVVGKDDSHAKGRVHCDSTALQKDGSEQESYFGDGRIVGCYSFDRFTHIIYIAHLADIETSNKPIVNNTGLQGEFLFDLAWSRLSTSQDQNKQSNSDEYTSFESALTNKLGLKLLPETIQTDAIVIDHVDQPTFD